MPSARVDARAEAAVNSAEPARKTRRWPILSATLPAGISSAAKTMVYAFNTQESSDAPVSEKVAAMSGKATYKIVVSRNVASVASDAMTSVRLE